MERLIPEKSGTTIIRRNAGARDYRQRDNREVWQTFPSPVAAGPTSDAFGELAILDEETLEPGASALSHVHDDAETIVYVRAGGLTCTGSRGWSGVVFAGEFFRAAAGVRHTEANPSRADSAHIFRFGFRSPGAGLEAGHERKHFSAAERRGRLRIVASLDARGGSLRVGHDVLVYSALLDPGQHVAYELPPGRIGWLHLVQGEASLGGIALSTGDGAGVRAQRGVSLTASVETELLLFDLVGPLRTLDDTGSPDGRIGC